MLSKVARPRIHSLQYQTFATGAPQAFKTETVGLVTKAEFMHKRNTLKERLEEEQRRSAKAATQAAQQVPGAARCVLPFAADQSVHSDLHRRRLKSSTSKRCVGQLTALGTVQCRPCESSIVDIGHVMCAC